MKRSIFLLLLTALPFSFFLAHTPKVQATEDPCAPLVVMYCTTCHTTQRICKALGKKDADAWKKTLTTMAEYGDIDKPTQKQVFECLSKKKAGDPAVCKK